jgi:hypothetical protein
LQNFLKPNKNFGIKKLQDKEKKIFLPDFYGDRAGIMAEFGKIICISIGIYDKNDKLLIRSFAGDNEEELLKEFGEIFNRPKLQNVILCAHNGKEFDFPWIARRFLINGMQPPIPFQMFGKNLGKFHILIQWNCGNLVIGKVLFL